MILAAALALAAPFAAAGPAAECLSAQHRGRNNEAVECFLRLTAAADPWARAEGFWGLKRYREANDEFRAAHQRRPKDPDLKVRWGRLLLERFNPGEAAELFQEALALRAEHAGALLGLALVAAEQFENKAVELARRALQADRELVEARVLLARMALEDGDADRARQEAEQALRVWPEALDAMAVLASIDWLADREDTPWMTRILAIHPRYGRAYATGARLLVLHRRYQEAVRFYRRALELDPELWEARSELGINLMRLGRDEEARRELEACYENGYRNAATVNALRLLDSYRNFVVLAGPRLVLKLHRKEAEVLRPYLEQEAERALRTYEAKYGFRLAGPVRIEVYPDHEDFAVRTLGMPGLPALGVTFETVVAMDSPSARRPGAFDWGGTLWHELNHVVVLNAARHRVPRWFAEGLAVYEEAAAAPHWGERLTPEVLAAIRDRKLLPVTQLERGFVRPAYPGQVVVSYYQAGRLCEFIARQWGFEKLRAMLGAFAERRATPEVVRLVLGVAAEELDARFLRWLEAETGSRAGALESWKRRMSLLTELGRNQRYADLVREATAARDLYPEYVEAGCAYEALAEAYLQQGDKAAAAAELARYLRAGGRDPRWLRKLAELEQQAGRKREAAAVLERTLYVDPLSEEIHTALGELYLELQQPERAVREFRAALALNPTDPAAAHYRLARAFRAANRLEEAKEHVLAALEAAPGYRPAQKLLLELNP